MLMALFSSSVAAVMSLRKTNKKNQEKKRNLYKWDLYKCNKERKELSKEVDVEVTSLIQY